MAKETITKIEAATRQLHSAIEMYFNDSDTVSIHTLVGAAHEILSRIAESKGMQSMKETLVTSFPETEQKTIRKKLHEARNFFKHADDDPNENLDFDEEYNELWLVDACHTHMLILEKKDPIILAYSIWYGTKHPNSVLGEELVKFMKHMASYNYDKRTFFEHSLPMLVKQANFTNASSQT